MTRSSRLVTVALLIGIVSVAGASLLADPAEEFNRSPRDSRLRPSPVRFQPCPFPPCMAPCQLGGEPQVLCRAPDGTVTATTYFCCCCGGSAGVSYRPL